MLTMKNSLQEYTESEFFEILEQTIDADEEDVDVLLDFFDEKVQHPKGYGLLTHPTMCGIEDSPQAVINELKRWYAEQGLPCFKSE
ncbi:bacteriocin immunity protein [Photobacterium halotolerans]|uniref:bacteriocin immunity protein n=1 Tax=Photobacterium halotolerans TaxID=265726 RepID=UPI000409644C|nr:bacteriocin immunity protein [Photobacterium halotolerans]